MTRPLARTLVVLLLPALCGALALWSLADRTDRLDVIPAAVVNLDQMVTEGDQPVAAGRLLAAELTQPTSAENESLDWTLTDADDAAAGLADGSYHAVVTIPEDFSATIAGAARALAGEGAAEPARIRVTSNDSASALVGILSDQIAQAAAASLGRTLTTTYVEQALGGFTELGLALGEAADGADRLADGAQELADGVAALDEGAADLATGLDGLAGGAGDLSAGVASLDDGADDLAGGARDLAGGARSLASGAGDLAEGAGTVASGAEAFAAGIAAARTDAEGLPAQARTLAGVADQVATGVGGLAQGLTGIAATCAAQGGSAQLCASLEAAAGTAGELAAGAAGVAGGVDGVASGADRMLTELGGQAQRLAGGARGVADGASDLADGAAGLATGAGRLASGAGTLAGGTGRLADGAAQLADGASTAADGARQLADGTSALAAGAPQLADGAAELAAGLAEGAAQVPASADAQADLAELVAQPVVAEQARINESPGGATDVAPLVVALGLWIGAFGTFLVREALPRRALAAPVGAGRVAWLGFRGAAGWAVVQAVVLAALLPLFDVSLASPVAAVLLTGLAALTFVAVVQLLVALWGRTGWVLTVLLLVLQTASLGGLVPIDTAPAFFRALHGVLPVPVAVDGLAHLTLGGEVGSLGACVGALLAWGLAAFVGSVLVARSRRRTTVERLAADVVPAAA